MTMKTDWNGLKPIETGWKAFKRIIKDYIALKRDL